MFSNSPTSPGSLKKASETKNQDINRSQRLSRRFSEDRSGSIGILFALALIPVLAIVGAAIDYSNALRIRSQMQAALDAATLAGGRELQVSGDAASAWSTSQNYFNSAVSSLPAGSFRSDGNGGTQAPHLTSDQASSVNITNSTVNLTAAAVYQPFLLPIIGINEIPIAVKVDGELLQGTSGNNGFQNLELVMMLDTTGSMSGTKIEALKSSAKDLVQIVVGNGAQSQYTSKVALAPFSNSVNVGTSINTVVGYASVASLIPGLDETPAVLVGPQFASAQSGGTAIGTPTPGFSQGGTHLVWHGWGGWGGGGGGCPWWNPNCNNNSDDDDDDDDDNGNGIQAPVTNCVTERTGVNQYTDVAPVSTESNTLFTQMRNSSYCPSSTAEIMPLTDDKTALNARIDNLPSTGGTAGHLGVAWAWYLVSPKWASIFPNNVPAAYQGDTKKVAVLMTDGQFNREYNGATNSPSYDNPDSTAQARQLCDNMKAEGIEIFTVGFELTAGSEAADTMEYCATAPIDVHRFFTNSTSELQEAYRQIGFGLKDLKLTR